MGQRKFYVVWEGRDTGVFNTWTDCEKQIKGYKGAKFKGYKTFKLASKAFSDGYEKRGSIEQPDLILFDTYESPNLDTISVDASCLGNPGEMEYQAVCTRTEDVIFCRGIYEDSTNNIGEFLALVDALIYMNQKGDSRPIYSDSKTAIAWVESKKANTTLVKTELNSDSFDSIKIAEAWLATNPYRNKILKWNTKDWGEIPADFGRK